MYLSTDDEIYRVDGVWLGPPKATFPWVARYVAYAIFIPLALGVLWAERQVGIGFGFFSTAWAVLLAVALTRFLGARITHERPLGAVLVAWAHELTTPRGSRRPRGAATDLSSVRVRERRPRPAAAALRPQTGTTCPNSSDPARTHPST